MIHSNIKAPSRSVPERVLFSSVCFPLGRLGHLVQLRTRTVSYKNHKVIKNDDEDMIVVKNTHEAIVSQELWDRVREMEQSVSQGKRNSSGSAV